MKLDLEAEVKVCVAEALALSEQDEAALGTHTELLGVHPDFGSMAVLALLTALEERLGMPVADEIGTDALLTVGTLIDALRPLWPGRG